jgi:hypothetical protein
MSILRRVERELEERMRRAFADSGAGEGRELLEVQHAILDEIAGKVQPVGRGRRLFPFRQVGIHIGVADAAQRPAFSLAFAEGDRLAADIRDTLREAGCEPPPDLTVTVVLEEREIAGGFSIVYHEKPAAPAPAPAVAAPPARLVVLGGRALAGRHEIGPARVNIGRLAEVLDDSQRVVRRNHVAFAESDDPVTATVSRAHAHIQYDPATGEYRLYDDHSAYGTSLFRDGALIAVPAGAGRGTALRSGDEIYFGQARTRFETV